MTKWRKLDNSAKIFPIDSDKNFSAVYRMSVLLTEDINPNLLKSAVDKTLESFTSFKVCLKRGFFWYYLEENQKEIIIDEEKNYPCKYIDKNTNNGYLFKVTYYKNKINVDTFHSLTDGSSSIEFIKAIAYNYIDLAHPDETKNIPEMEVKQNIEVNDKNTEDSYIKNYQKHLKSPKGGKKAYILSGKRIPLYGVGVTHGFINLKQIIKRCRKLKVTVTQYFTAVLIYAIYQEYIEKNKGKKFKRPIKICIPVNLKKYFESTTITNFFSYISINADIKEIDLLNFDQILKFVHDDFKKKLDKTEIARTMMKNIKLGNNIGIKLIPLFLKRPIVKISYIEIRKYSTTTLSNIGKVNVLPEYQKYIDNFLFLIAPDRGEKIKCSTMSYKDNIIFTITSILKNPGVEKKFFEYLEKENTTVKIETNGVHENKESKLYPKIRNINRSNKVMLIMTIISFVIGITSLIVNHFVTRHFKWSLLVIAGVIYTWITVMNSIKKNVNIASRVMLQVILIDILCVALDWIIGYRGWSFTIAIPISIITANVTMLILLMCTFKIYARYIIYQLIIFVWSMIPVVLCLIGWVPTNILTIIATPIAIFSLLLTIILFAKDVNEEMKKRFHI